MLYSTSSGQAPTRNIYLGDRVIAESNASTGAVFDHTDVLGSPIARTDASGQLLSRTSFEPYGRVAGGISPVGVGFTGHVQDADTALVYMQQRYYDPLAGRFLSVDPVTTDEKTGDLFNRYVYGQNNPYRYTDPDGRSALDIGFFVFDAVKFGVAVYTGVGVGAAAVDLGISALGVASPIPGLGEAIKGVRIAEKGVEVARGAEKAGEIAKGTAGGERAGKAMTPAGKAEVKAENAAQNGGQTTCNNCGQSTAPGKQSQSGVTPPGNETHVDHIVPKSKGGDGLPSNGQVLCRDCNLKKSDN